MEADKPEWKEFREQRAEEKTAKRVATKAANYAKQYSKYPRFYSPLLKKLSARIRYVQHRRGISKDRAAQQVGIDVIRYHQFYEGTATPSAVETERLARWAIEGIDFSTQPLPIYDYQKKQYPGWTKVTCYIPSSKAVAVRRACQKLGTAPAVFARVAIERLIAHESIIHTYAEAMRQLEQAWLAELLHQDGALYRLLTCEEQFLGKIPSSKLTPIEHLDAVEAPIPKLLARIDRQIKLQEEPTRTNTEELDEWEQI